MLISTIYLAVLLAILKINPTSQNIITTPLGTIEGTTGESLNGKIFFKFEGVPYAKPPVGKLRFEAPQELQPWRYTWQAKTIHKCLQYNHGLPEDTDVVLGEEDCLYLNIYTPTLKANASLNVIFFIHGGAFMFNYGGKFGPEILLQENVVLVTINYRVGPFGFLSTEDDVVPGNMGLKDQVAALKWVKKYISHFGGNPESITLAGNSAGAASVHLHYLIKESNGLFKNGISQSGCALNPWVLMEAPLAKSRKLATATGCPVDSTRSLVNCLKHRPGRQIAQAVKLFQEFLYNPFSPWGVVVDKWASSPLLPEHPFELLLTGQIYNAPWIVSFTDAEGLYPLAEFYSDTIITAVNNQWHKILPNLLHYEYTAEDAKQNEISNSIKEFYMKNKNLTKGNFRDFVKIASDRLFLVDIDKAAKLQSKKSPVYVYDFSYTGEKRASEIRSRSKDFLGAAHTEDLDYIMYLNNFHTFEATSDKDVSNLLLKIWTTFAKNNAPDAGINWPDLSQKNGEQLPVLKIPSAEKIQIEYSDGFADVEFWNALPLAENERLLSVKDEL